MPALITGSFILTKHVQNRSQPTAFEHRRSSMSHGLSFLRPWNIFTGKNMLNTNLFHLLQLAVEPGKLSRLWNLSIRHTALKYLFPAIILVSSQELLQRLFTGILQRRSSGTWMKNILQPQNSFIRLKSMQLQGIMF